MPQIPLSLVTLYNYRPVHMCVLINIFPQWMRDISLHFFIEFFKYIFVKFSFYSRFQFERNSHDISPHGLKFEMKYYFVSIMYDIPSTPRPLNWLTEKSSEPVQNATGVSPTL